MTWITIDNKEFDNYTEALKWELYLKRQDKPINKPRLAVIEKPSRVKKPKYDKYTEYLLRAASKNRSFDFTTEEFYALIAQNCEYCGKPNANTIDRVDSNLGYTWDNSVPCCWNCNRMKFDMTKNEFINHIKSIYSYLNLNIDQKPYYYKG